MLVTLNVGGKMFTTTKDTLMRYSPNLFSDTLEYNKSHYLFFDREATNFHLILNYLRGFDIPVPTAKLELEILLEEAKYYKVNSLVEQFDKLINMPMPNDEKKKLIDNIKKKIYELKIEHLKSTTFYLEKMSDQELLNLQRDIAKYESDSLVKTLEQNIFNSCLLIVRYFEKSHNFKDACSRFMSNSLIAKKIIENIVISKEVKYYIYLFTFLINILFEKESIFGFDTDMSWRFPSKV